MIVEEDLDVSLSLVIRNSVPTHVFSQLCSLSLKVLSPKRRSSVQSKDGTGNTQINPLEPVHQWWKQKRDSFSLVPWVRRIILLVFGVFTFRCFTTFY